MRLYSTNTESRLASKRRQMMGSANLSGRKQQIPASGGRPEVKKEYKGTRSIGDVGGDGSEGIMRGGEEKGAMNESVGGSRGNVSGKASNAIHSVAFQGTGSPARNSNSQNRRSNLRKSLLKRPNMRDEGRLPRIGSSAWNMQNVRSNALTTSKSRQRMVELSKDRVQSTSKNLDAHSSQLGSRGLSFNVEARMKALEAGQAETQALLRKLLEKMQVKV